MLLRRFHIDRFPVYFGSVSAVTTDGGVDESIGELKEKHNSITVHCAFLVAYTTYIIELRAMSTPPTRNQVQPQVPPTNGWKEW